MMLLSSLCVFSQATDSLSFTPAVSNESEQITHSYVPNKEVMHSSLFGFGVDGVYDSYLSPFAHGFTALRAQRETMRMTNLLDGRVANQTFIDFNASVTEKNDDLSGIAGGLRYSQAWLYNFRDCNVVNPAEHSTRKWNYAAGLQASGYIGGIYYNRSGNNPGQAKADVMVNATGIVSYTFFRRKHRPMVLSYQLTFPLLGAAFSPNYGQSYYEIFELGKYDHNVVFANTFNMPSNRHRIMFDMPLKRANLRLGYDIQINQAKMNNLEYLNYSVGFMIGFTKYYNRR